MLEAFVDAATDALFAMDAQGRIVLWNRSAERICGYAADDVLGRPLPVLFPSDLRERAATLVDAVLAGDRVDRWETTFERRTGMPVPVSLSVRPVVDADGAAIGAVAIARGHHRAAARAGSCWPRPRRGCRRARPLAHVGRWLWDVATGTVQWSDEFHRIHGVDPLEFDGTLEAHLGRIVPEERAQVRDALERAVATGRAVDVDYAIQRRRGSRRNLSTRAEPTIGSSGDVVGLRGIGRDVTDA